MSAATNKSTAAAEVIQVATGLITESFKLMLTG
jgi:hypothetical protein